MTLQEAIMPVSWYAISESRGNNKFILNVAEPISYNADNAYSNSAPWWGKPDGTTPVGQQPTSGDTIFKSYVVTIPDGNYSPPFGGEEGLEKLEDAVNDAHVPSLASLV